MSDKIYVTVDESELAELREKLAAAERSAREMHIAADEFLREIRRLTRENQAMRDAMRAEHFRSNGSSVYMDSPQHERSIKLCGHPLCRGLEAAQAEVERLEREVVAERMS